MLLVLARAARRRLRRGVRRRPGQDPARHHGRRRQRRWPHARRGGRRAARGPGATRRGADHHRRRRASSRPPRPAELGLGVDYVASVREAGAGRSWEPGWLWNYYTGGDDLDPVVTVSEMTMTDYLAELAETRRPAGPRRQGPLPGHAGQGRQRPGRPVHRPAAGPRGDHGGVPLRRPDGGRRPGRRAARHRRRRRPRGRRRRSPTRPSRARSTLVLRRQPGAPAAARLRRGAVAAARATARSSPTSTRRSCSRLVDEQVAGDGGAPVDATVALVDGRPKVIPAKPGVTLRPGRGDGRLHRGADQAGGRARGQRDRARSRRRRSPPRTRGR